MTLTAFQNSKTSALGGIVLVTLTTAVATAAPPKVVRTVPTDGARDVDPRLSEIRITFDQDMDQSGMSICGGGPAFRKARGKPRWASARVLVVPVQLEPDQFYVLSVNCPSASNCRNLAGEPVEPHPLKFSTAAAKGSAASKPADKAANAAAIKELRRAIDEDYSHRDLRKVNWDELFAKHRPAMEAARNPHVFGSEAARLLTGARDTHIWLKAGDEIIKTFDPVVALNCDLKALARLVPGWQQRSSCVYTGRYPDGPGYILITSWLKSEGNPQKAAIEALREFEDAKGLIVDVRPNFGGAEPLAQEFAGHFIDKPVVYAKHVLRRKSAPGGFTPVGTRQITPAREGPKFHGKLAVLMGRGNRSSCEAFLLMMKQVPGCKLIGETSFGSSGNPQPHDLGNGVVVFLPSWKSLRLDGSCIEGEGIAPDIQVDYTRASDSDNILDAARTWLRQP